VPLLRIKKDVAIDPRVLLLTQIRAPLQGESDSSLLFMREHYTYRGGKTTLFHQVRSFGPSMVAPRDCALFQTWEENEDGSIYVAAKSVEGNIPLKSIPGAVRAPVLLFGMQIIPKTVTVRSFLSSTEVEGCEVTVLSHSPFKGFVPGFAAKQFVISQVFSYLASAEITAKALEQEGNLDDLINRYVIYPDEPSGPLVSDDEEEADGDKAEEEEDAPTPAEVAPEIAAEA